MTRAIGIAAMVIAAAVAVGCGLRPEEQAGLACQRPLPGAEPIEVAPAPPLLGGMSPQEADEAIRAANVDADVTWRYHYSTEIGAGPSGYSKCWCIPPPDRRGVPGRLH